VDINYIFRAALVFDYADKPLPAGLAKALRTIKRRDDAAVTKLKRRPTFHDRERMDAASEKRSRKDSKRCSDQVNCAAGNWCLDGLALERALPLWDDQRLAA
jgi:hypothetical protein